jgi:hypothetical protein
MALRSRSRFWQNEIDLFDLVDGAIASRRQAKASMETGAFLAPFDVRADLSVAVGYRFVSAARKSRLSCCVIRLISQIHGFVV